MMTFLLTQRQTIHQTNRRNRINNVQEPPGLVVLSAFLFFFTCLLFPLSLFAQLDPASKNALDEHASPYLAMHGKDPVNWQLWQPSVLKTAQKNNQLIFLSSGYFSCHWCHVMQQENYQNTTVATYLNQHFLSVKIDRELSPDIDQYLIQFAQKAAGHAGWPQHVILTPDGLPFFAFVYQPKAQLLTTLKRVVALWKSSPDQVRQAALKAISKPDPVQTQPLRLTQHDFIQRFNQQLSYQADELSGGLKASNKFPNAAILQTAFDQKNRPDMISDWLQLTLDQMQSQHLFDHVNGGFYRYTIDPEWQTPHFEKMLYTQALLAKLYYQAGNEWQRKDYIETARQTLKYAETHLWNPKTQLFRGSQSAIDQNNIEGGNYLLTKETLKKKLPPDAYEQVRTEWQLDQPAPYDAGWHPKPTRQFWPIIQARLQSHPDTIPTDTKSILGWNGLMLSAYVTAYQSDPTHSKQIKQKAQRLAQRLIQAFQADPPRAFSLENKPMGKANIQDYAFVLQGLKDWQAMTKQRSIQTTLLKLQQQAETIFLSSQGWHYSDAPALPGQHGIWAMEDDALPSPTAILDCGNSAHLANSQNELQRYPLAYASYATAWNCHSLTERTD
ncbi:MAG: thioredoxin domain-containing protein [Thiomicrospira sp.]|nr:MAG: thioredoxin domain-containing protein [Thiomicrospira sp.]